MGKRLALVGCALAIYPMVGLSLLIASQSWFARSDDKTWPVILFCLVIPFVLAGVTSRLARLNIGSALLIVAAALVGGGVTICLGLTLASAFGDLS